MRADAVFRRAPVATWASFRLLGAGAALVMLLGAPGAGSDPAGALVPKPQAAPARLSETGLYDEPNHIDPRNVPFEPQYPLWSDGAAKSRWVYLPPGTTIDVSSADAWRFPPGTKFWKEFSFGGRRVETRMIWKATDSAWGFAAYVWNEEQTEALLAPPEGIRGVAAIGTGKYHSIPSVSDCGACHASSPATVLGFNALQLSDDRDPLAPHTVALPAGAVTLRTLETAGRLSPPRPDWVSSPPRIRATSVTARAAMGYLSANCGGCHYGGGPLAGLGLNLLHAVDAPPGAEEPALASALNARSHFVVPGTNPDSSRVLAPGHPENSSLFHRMRTRRPSSQMPPLGTVLVDEEAVELVRTWITSLDTTLIASRPVR